MRENPSLVARADLRGDLRASVLAALEHDADAGQSELDLARCSGGSRAQVRSALDNLELTGKALPNAQGPRAPNAHQPRSTRG